MTLQAKKRLCLFGYPGVGKTSCALEFSYQQMDKNNLLFDGISCCCCCWFRQGYYIWFINNDIALW